MLASQESVNFFDNCDSLLSAQQEMLKSILQTNRDCEYGKKYHFADIETPRQYTEHVPLITFEDIRSYADRMAAGESNILSTERVLAFFKTSGSLAAPKMIPVTPSFVRQKARAFGVFWQEVYTAHPALKTGRIIANFTDSGEVERTEAGQEVLSEATFWGRRSHGLHSKERWPIPKELRQVKDSTHRHYAAARLVLQGPLHGIMCLNPSTLLMFCRTIEASLPQLLAGVRNGTWGREDQDFLNGLPDSLQDHLTADPDRAIQLETLLKQARQLELTQLWPELEQVICWRSQIVQPYFQQLAPYLAGVACRDYITQSSECIMAIAVEDEVSGGILAYQSHFYEFIPESEIDAEHPQTLFAWELQQGSVYELVVTTGGGFYRYRMGDCIRVNGFRGQVPLIEFLYRAGKTSSMTGEKLTEYQIVEAAKRAGARFGGSPEEMLCFPRSGENPHYGILLHWEGRAQADIAAWLAGFDEQLKSVNGEYGDKCASGRLGPVVGLMIGADGFAQYRQMRKAAKVSDAQLKNDLLSAKLDLDRQLPVTEVIHAG